MFWVFLFITGFWLLVLPLSQPTPFEVHVDSHMLKVVPFFEDGLPGRLPATYDENSLRLQTKIPSLLASDFVAGAALYSHRRSYSLALYSLE